mmetsp:Transcript_70860/g.122746  ORF Transcript_70860/g.122746 Transcript_70860/m.122746 type:complete len:223 (+) Transcript_70860:3224-3892(+)
MSMPFGNLTIPSFEAHVTVHAIIRREPHQIAVHPRRDLCKRTNQSTHKSNDWNCYRSLQIACVDVQHKVCESDQSHDRSQDITNGSHHLSHPETTILYAELLLAGSHNLLLEAGGPSKHLQRPNIVERLSTSIKPCVLSREKLMPEVTIIVLQDGADALSNDDHNQPREDCPLHLSEECHHCSHELNGEDPHTQDDPDDINVGPNIKRDDIVHCRCRLSGTA